MNYKQISTKRHDPEFARKYIPKQMRTKLGKDYDKWASTKLEGFGASPKVILKRGTNYELKKLLDWVVYVELF